MKVIRGDEWRRHGRGTILIPHRLSSSKTLRLKYLDPDESCRYKCFHHLHYSSERLFWRYVPFIGASFYAINIITSNIKQEILDRNFVRTSPYFDNKSCMFPDRTNNMSSVIFLHKHLLTSARSCENLTRNSNFTNSNASPS